MVGITNAQSSWAIGEKTAIGLPLVYPLLKTAVPIAFILFMLAALSTFLKNIIFVAKGERI